MKRQARTARTPRFHYAGQLHVDSRVTLPKATSHHLMKVLRMREGDTIELFTDDGHNYAATVIDTGHRTPGGCTSLHVWKASPVNTESPVDITLLQGICRGDRMDASVRQSVELGVQRIQPIYTRHSVKPLDRKRTAKKIEHWQAIVVSACEQSGRTRLPILSTPVQLVDWVSGTKQTTHAPRQWQQLAQERSRAGEPRISTSPPRAARASSGATPSDAAMPILVLDPLAATSLVSDLHQWRSYRQTDEATATNDEDGRIQTPCRQQIALIIGPESGLDADEIEQLVTIGATPVSLGPRILRTESAGPACIAIVQSVLGDMM